MTKSLIDRIKKHAAFVKTIEVPEWGVHDAPLIIRARAMSLSRHSSCMAKARDGDGVLDEGLFKALIIYHTALDDDGEKLFSLENVPDLQAADGDVVERVYKAIVTAASLKDLEKN